MPIVNATVNIPEGYEPKYVDERGFAQKTHAKKGEEYLYLEENGTVLTCIFDHTETLTYVLKRVETYADKVRAWWPECITAPWFAADKDGAAFFYECEPSIGTNRVAFGSHGNFYRISKLVSVTTFAPPPALEGDWRDSKVRNPHLEK